MDQTQYIKRFYNHTGIYKHQNISLFDVESNQNKKRKTEVSTLEHDDTIMDVSLLTSSSVAKKNQINF